jgi:hypothetical protein
MSLFFLVIASFPYPAGYRTGTLNSVYLLREKVETTLKKNLGENPDFSVPSTVPKAFRTGPLLRSVSSPLMDVAIQWYSGGL